MAREFIKKFETAYDKQQHRASVGGGYATHSVNDANSSHYLKENTYSKTEADTLLDLKEDFVISGLTTQYYRGDKTWQNFDDAVAGAFSASIPILLTGTDFSLNYNSTNLKITSSNLNTIQNINSSAEPTFNQLNLNNAASASNDAVRADRQITITTTSPLTGSSTKTLTTNISWTLGVTASDLLGTTNRVTVSNGANKILGSFDVTLTLPQDIHTGASPQFTGLTLTGQATIQGTSTNSIYGNIEFFNDKKLFHTSFTSGWAGAGWRLDEGVATASMSTLELDDLWVRGTMNVYELIINQIRATNGSLLVSSAAKVADVQINGFDVSLVFEDPGTHNVVPFLVGDILLMQRVRLDTTSIIKKIAVEVMSVSNMTCGCNYLFQSTGPAVPEAGDDFVRIGSTSNTSRQGVVYLTSDDSGSPFIDIIDGITSYADWGDSEKTKCRFGKLDGIITNAGQALADYGTYENRLYVEGQAEIRGELSVGDDTTFGNSFYAGRINKNLLLISQDTEWGNSDCPIYYWQSGASTRTTPSVTLPDGTTGDCMSMLATSASVFSIIGTETARATTGNQSTNTYTMSFWVKATGAVTAVLHTTIIEYPIDTSIDSSQTFTATTSWQRVSFTITLPSGASGDRWRILIQNKISATDALYFWGFQVEKKSYETMYQPTDGTLSLETDFGMWASKGGFGGSIQNPRINIIDKGIIIRSSDSSSRSWIGDDTISIGYSGSVWGIIGKEGSTIIFQLGSINKICGYTFDNDKFYAGSATAGIALNTSSTPFITGASAKGFEIYDSGNPKMFIGKKDGDFMDYNVTAADTLTVTANIRSSIFSTGTDIIGNTSTYAALAHENPTRPYLRIQEYTDVSNNSFCTLNPDTQTGFQWFHHSGGVTLANIFMFRGLTVKSAYMKIDGQKVGRVRDRGSSEPTDDLRQGDTWYRVSGNVGFFMYDTSAGWVKIS